MPTVDENWTRIYPAVQDLKLDSANEPGLSWNQRREAFLDRLGLRDPDEDPAVALLIRRLDDLPDEERDGLLGTDELDALAYEAAQQGAVAGDAYDESAWHAYLAANGPAWDGTDESWAGFRDWFAYYAADQGLSTPATALLDYLEGLAAPDRIAAFAQDGVTISPAGLPVDEPAGNEARALDELAAIAERVPGFDQLSREEIAEVVATVMQERQR